MLGILNNNTVRFIGLQLVCEHYISSQAVGLTTRENMNTQNVTVKSQLSVVSNPGSQSNVHRPKTGSY